VQAFLDRHALRHLDGGERVTVLELLEMQRHAMLMYTSCGWFFDELSGPETVQVLQYAARAVQLAARVVDEHLEPAFVDRLAACPSNVPEHGDGRGVYEALVRPAMVDLRKVAAHFAVSFPFVSYAGRARVYGFPVELGHARVYEAGRARLAVGRMHVSSGVTMQATPYQFGVLHLGDHNLCAGVRVDDGDASYVTLVDALSIAFRRADVPAVLRLLDLHFPDGTFALPSLFRDEQRRILDRILADTLEAAEASYRQLYENHAPLMRFLVCLPQPLPKAFSAAAELVLDVSLRRAFQAPELDLDRIRHLVRDARDLKRPLDARGLGFALSQAIERTVERLLLDPLDGARAIQTLAAVQLARGLPLEVDWWRTQNLCWGLLTQDAELPRDQAERLAAIAAALGIAPVTRGR
jgi:hypothetical protein